MADLQRSCDAPQEDEDPYASVPGTLSKFLTGDLSFDEFTKTSLEEELMAADEVAADSRETNVGGLSSSAVQEVDASNNSDAGGHLSPARDVSSEPKLAESFVNELTSIQTTRKRSLMTTVVSTPATKKRKLPGHLQAVMGEANLRLARGDALGAQKLCKEVIRQAPQIHGPYMTLAMAYEETGDYDKSYQLLLIAAHLQQKNYDLWVKLAGLAMERENARDALLCISKAIRLKPGNPELAEQKAILLTQMGEHRQALHCFETALNALPAKSGPRYLDRLKQMARCCHELSMYSRAIELLITACNSFQGSPDPEVVNILAELYMLTKQHNLIYELIVKYYQEDAQQGLHEPSASSSAMLKEKDISISSYTQTGSASGGQSSTVPTPSSPLTPTDTVQGFSINLSTAVEMSMQLDVTTNLINASQLTSAAAEKEAGSIEGSTVQLRLRDDVPIDLRAKLIVSMIYLGMIPNVEIIGPLISEDPECCGDLYLDIAEAYMENGLPSMAFSYLSALVKTDTFDQAAVWLRHAVCLHQMGNLEDAANSYAAVLVSVPHHTEARLKLVEIYIALGRSDDALAILDQETPAVEEEMEVEIEETRTGDPNHQTVEKLSDFTLPHHDLRLSYHKFLLLQAEGQLEESLCVSTEVFTCYFRNIAKLNVVLAGERKRARRRPVNITDEQEKQFREREKVLTRDEWYSLFSKTCYTLFKLQRLAELRNWLITAINSGYFDKKYNNDLHIMTVSVCLAMKDYRIAFQVLKQLYKLPPRIPDVVWIFHSRLPRRMFNYRIILRKLVKDTRNPLLLFLCGNFSYTGGHYQIALGFYKEICRLHPNNALVCLLVGLCFIGMVGKGKGATFSHFRNTMLIQAFAFFLKYARLRGESQEAYYNLGRAFHHMGLVHVAVNFYKKALITPMCHLSQSSLSREAAFNLSLIYRASGNSTLARLTLSRYFTI